MEDIRFSVKKGEKLALVGYNGAGKTTLLELLLGLYRGDSGKIWINGKDLSEYPPGTLRNSFACVFQDFKMLPVSIAENVSMSHVYDEARVQAALEKCGLRSYIEGLPQGIHTILTEEYADQGVGVSGGQMQKIAVARALYQGGGISHSGRTCQRNGSGQRV